MNKDNKTSFGGGNAVKSMNKGFMNQPRVAKVYKSEMFDTHWIQIDDDSYRCFETNNLVSSFLINTRLELGELKEVSLREKVEILEKFYKDSETCPIKEAHDYNEGLKNKINEHLKSEAYQKSKKELSEEISNRRASFFRIGDQPLPTYTYTDSNGKIVHYINGVPHVEEEGEKVELVFFGAGCTTNSCKEAFRVKLDIKDDHIIEAVAPRPRNIWQPAERQSPRKINLIGISGVKGAGKDEVIKIIQQETTSSKYLNRSKWKTKRFSNKLKQSVAVLYGVTIEDLEDRDFKENVYYHFKTGEILNWEDFHLYYKSGLVITCLDATRLKDAIKNLNGNVWTNFRTILQYEGAEVGREMRGEKLWINSELKNYNDNSFFAFGDVRFTNELEELKNRGALLIRLVNPEKEKSVDSHSSETEFQFYNKYDEIIINDGSLDDLRVKVREIVKKYNL